MPLIVKAIVGGLIISLVSWLSGTKSTLAGFITALPITTMLALAFSYMEWSDPAKSTAYAKSIFVAVPLSLLFFVPFLFAEKFQLGFWSMYFSGTCLLLVGYAIHRAILA
jgi:uncharacterized membrane protein (GlpM family)